MEKIEKALQIIIAYGLDDCTTYFNCNGIYPSIFSS